MTSDDPSPYLFESQVEMLGRLGTAARRAPRSRHGWRRYVAMVGIALIVLVLVSLVLGILTPFISPL